MLDSAFLGQEEGEEKKGEDSNETKKENKEISLKNGFDKNKLKYTDGKRSLAASRREGNNNTQKRVCRYARCREIHESLTCPRIWSSWSHTVKFFLPNWCLHNDDLSLGKKEVTCRFAGARRQWGRQGGPLSPNCRPCEMYLEDIRCAVGVRCNQQNVIYGIDLIIICFYF